MKDKSSSASLAAAERYCRSYLSHYENFPLKSIFFPRDKFQDLANIYAFCRYSDDLGDEGEIEGETGRIAAARKLDEWEKDLLKCPGGNPDHPILTALQKTLGRYDLPLKPFRDLISAFRQDQSRLRYSVFDELTDYCLRSANPVGRIYLMLFGIRDEERFALSDKICTGLQLANFWQDVSADIKKGRIYIPQEDFERFGYLERQLEEGIFNQNFRELMKFETERTARFFSEGAELENLLSSRLRLEVKMFRLGGEKVLRKIAGLGFNVIDQRPVIGKFDKLIIFVKALTYTWI